MKIIIKYILLFIICCFYFPALGAWWLTDKATDFIEPLFKRVLESVR